tara:strand:+ start:212 stop:589 length:378 start_codon:yes stop_codon:yes gene_type:complete
LDNANPINGDQISWIFSAIDRRKRLFDDGIDEVGFASLVAIAHGHLRGAPFDITSLSSWLSIPRTNCQRLVESWEAAGLCERSRSGRRALLVPTTKCFEKLDLLSSYIRANPMPDGCTAAALSTK